MKNLLFVVLLSAGTLCSSGLSAQLTAYHLDPDASFKQAKDLYQKELFSLAYPIFQQLNTADHTQSPMPATVQRECRYYYLVCGLQLNDSSIVNGAESFIALETDPARVQMLNFQLGEYFFRQRNYAKAQACYQSVGIANLSNREIAEMKFHQAYGYFVMQQFREAKPLFNAIRQLPDDPNYLDANYYYGFICFSEKQYPAALDAFRIAKRLPAYQSVIPFYLAEIFYFTGNRDSALYYGEDALKKPAQFYTLQLQQLVGHIWFEKKEFDKAKPYLEAYVAGNTKVRREDLYELSFCYYHAAQWDKCIEGFKQLSGAQDSLSQNSMYLLADAYLKVHDKANARTAFQFCASSNSNPRQKEVSSFNYAKLSYDLGYMDAALQAFKAFVADFPRSEYLQEARELLVNTLANTSNYKEALQLYDELPQRSDYAVHLYPRLLYGASVEYINDQQLDRADALLTRLLSVPYNQLQLPLAYFWKGEIAYRNGQNDASIGFFLNYLKRPVPNGEVNITNARYSLAYGYLRTEDYTLARDYFEMVTKTISPDATPIVQDAYLRTADCYYMAKDFARALKMYEQVIQMRLPSADYALYQKAIIAGAQNHNDEKIRLLSTLDKQYPASAYLPDASLEIANTYLADENFEAALAPLHKLITSPNAGVLLPKAYLKSGIANFNLNKNDAALKDFTKLVTSYPNTTECNAAIEYIRNIFVENQQPGAFADFMKQNGRPISDAEADSLTFRSAMLRYEAKDAAGAKAGFTRYLQAYPQGRNAVEANYHVAELYMADKDWKNALPYFQAVADASQNPYSEASTLQTARIYYFEKQQYDTAALYYASLKKIAVQQENRLEAMRGLLRCQFKRADWKAAADNATELLKEKGIATDDKMMANMVVARNQQDGQDWESAMNSYKQVIAAGKSEYAAEAQYRIAEILFQQQKYQEAEKAGFEVIHKMGSYNYWVTKSYILLGDVYTAEKDWFNAEATFRSVSENAEISELREEAKQKLDAVLAAKAQTNKVAAN